MIAIALLLSTFNFVLLKLNPMVEMAFRSQCKNPLTSWNGKVLGIRIWKDSSKNVPPQFSIRGNVDEYSNDKWSSTYMNNSRTITKTIHNRQSADNLRKGKAVPVNNNNNNIQKPIILWGSHHKTGTVLANNIFSTVCARMNWCCKFHTSR